MTVPHVVAPRTLTFVQETLYEHQSTFRPRLGGCCPRRRPGHLRRRQRRGTSGPQLQGREVLRHRQGRQERLRLHGQQFVCRNVEARCRPQGLAVRPCRLLRTHRQRQPEGQVVPFPSTEGEHAHESEEDIALSTCGG